MFCGARMLLLVAVFGFSNSFSATINFSKNFECLAKVILLINESNLDSDTYHSMMESIDASFSKLIPDLTPELADKADSLGSMNIFRLTCFYSPEAKRRTKDPLLPKSLEKGYKTSGLIPRNWRNPSEIDQFDQFVEQIKTFCYLQQRSKDDIWDKSAQSICSIIFQGKETLSLALKMFWFLAILYLNREREEGFEKKFIGEQKNSCVELLRNVLAFHRQMLSPHQIAMASIIISKHEKEERDRIIKEELIRGMVLVHRIRYPDHE